MGYTILVVEDEQDIREVLKEILEFEDHRVFTSSNGKEALETLKKIPKPDIILLDLMMPIMNGWEFLEVKHQTAALSKIPVIVLSAATGKAAPPHISAYMKKPIQLDSLLSLIKEHVAA